MLKLKKNTAKRYLIDSKIFTPPKILRRLGKSSVRRPTAAGLTIYIRLPMYEDCGKPGYLARTWGKPSSSSGLQKLEEKTQLEEKIGTFFYLKAIMI